MTDPLPAGRPTRWVLEVRSGDADVPCGTCVACCTSAQFVLVTPVDAGARRRIPRELLVPAPGLPRGHLLMGFDERGRCPMLGDAGCAIYADRPATCRAYDCRVFAAAATGPPEGKPAIAERVARWRFDVADGDDAARLAAIRGAAAFLHRHAGELPAGAVPAGATQLAHLAVVPSDLFLDGDPALDEVEAALRRARLAG